jgi:alpha-beta hydrolase superfamily lysophospholipase
LFLSPGAALRCGQANFASLAGDALAAAGFTVLRFDFPGLGDSPGPVAEHTDAYHVTVERGALAALAVDLVAEARRRYGLDAVVIGGLCGGAVTGLYTVDRDADGIAGVIVVEPVFKLSHPPPRPHPSGGAGARRRATSVVRTAANRLRSAVVGRVRGVLRRSRIVTRVRSMWRCAAPGVFGEASLGARTNFALIRAFRRVAGRRVPMLVVFSDREQLRFVRHVVLADVPAHDTAYVMIDGTNHIFSYGMGKYRLVDAIGQWVGTRFGSRDTTPLPNNVQPPFLTPLRRI